MYLSFSEVNVSPICHFKTGDTDLIFTSNFALEMDACHVLDVFS